MRTDRPWGYLFATLAAVSIVMFPACTDRAPANAPDVAGPAPTTPGAAAEIARLRGTMTSTGSAPAAASSGDASDPWQMSRQDVVDRFMAAADAGDPQAAYVVGRRLAECHAILRDDTPQAVLDSYRNDLEHLQSRQDAAGNDVVRGNIERNFAMRVDRFEACNALAPELLARSAAWLEQAAAAGHSDARRDYARLAMAEFDTREGIIRQPLEARRRQGLARGYLEDALRAGDRAALQTYVEAQRGRGPLYPENLRNAQVYGYVQQLAAQQPRPPDPQLAALHARIEQTRVERGGASQADAFEALLRDGPSRYPPDAFSDAEWREIASEGRRIFEDAFRSDAPAR